MNIAHSVEGIVAFSYFISTYYTEQAIEETKTPQNDTLYYLFKKGSSPGPQFNIESCAKLNRTIVDYYKVLELASARTFISLAFWLNLICLLLFDIDNLFKKIDNEVNKFGKIFIFIKKNLIKLYFIPGVVIIDSLDFTTHCVQESFLIQNTWVVYFILICNVFYFFVIWAVFAYKLRCSRFYNPPHPFVVFLSECESRPNVTFFEACIFISMIYFCFALAIYAVNYLGSFLGIIINATITLDIFLSILFSFLQRPVPVRPA